MTTTIISQNKYLRQEIQEAIDQAISSMGGFEYFFAGKQSILLKPNFVVPEHFSKGSTTHPDFYMAIAHYFRDYGKQVAIGESPSVGSCAMALRSHKVLQECKQAGIHYFTFSKPKEYVGVNSHRQFQTLTVAKELDEFDAIVNLPKLKVHKQCVFTGAVKNLYGCVTGKRKAYRHFVCNNDPVLFSEMLLANLDQIPLTLSIADGIIALEKEGPRNGDPYPLGKIVISTDPLELDWIFCEMIRLDQKSTPLFQAVSEEKQKEIVQNILPIINDNSFTRVDNFTLAEESDIAFSLGRMIRSVTRSVLKSVHSKQ